VAEEKFGSLRVHCSKVPAGKTASRALALKVTPRRETSRVPYRNLYFIVISPNLVFRAQVPGR
jgi:hypothetical protein